eukprot:CAMPEP_0174833264 /NCGR_PEP_ID=MMETSP1114-20130205/4134_1 /TAXON_ID=312471 /ORGANISM="Neobodo designis, Strain CCAP 1951/1" /LENGTH=85 /DNA_ID=CAMNT_0016067139 /DNA_START=80 /DNA_END=334 /DNA_ORIENTATION=+
MDQMCDHPRVQRALQEARDIKFAMLTRVAEGEDVPLSERQAEDRRADDILDAALTAARGEIGRPADGATAAEPMSEAQWRGANSA